MTKRHRQVVLAAVGGFAALVAVALAALQARRGDDIRIQTAEVTSGTIARQVMVTGTLKPERAVEVGSQVSGTIASIPVDFNSTVRAGQVLARLDPSAYEAKLLEAQARVAQARSELTRLQVVLDDARVKLARAEELGADAMMPRAELDLARTTAKQAAADVKGAEAAVAAAQATVTEARVNLNHTTIRSPIDGVVVSRHVEVGQTISASVQTPVLFTLADLRRMQLLAEVAESDVGGVRPGSVVSFQIESMQDRSFKGTVAAVRLQPVIAQSAASSSGLPGGAPSAVGTSGASTPSPTPVTAASASGSTASTTSAASTQSGGTSSPTPAATQSSTQGSSSSAPGSSSSASGSSTSRSNTPPIGVVTYTAVVNVDNVEGSIPPGGTAIITLDGARRPNVARIPNNALTFHPSAEAFASVNQEPPIQSPRDPASARSSRNGLRQAYVWKFENRRFVPVRIETGLADDSWTELVSGPLSAGDVLVTAADTRRRVELGAGSS